MNIYIRYILIISTCIISLFLTGCEHDNVPEKDLVCKELHIRLKYESDDFHSKISDSSAFSYAYIRGITEEDKQIRYIIRIYPANKKLNKTKYIKEIKHIHNARIKNDSIIKVDLNPGEYEILVWSDFVKNGKPQYNADNFGEITLTDSISGNSNFHKAFRGLASVEINDSTFDEKPIELEVLMRCPQAKFEIVANDLVEFIESENSNESELNSDDTTFNLKDYTVILYYIGFKPDTYSLYTDKPVDSSTGIMFSSSLKRLTETNATIGFDYVFVGEKKSAVTVRIAVYNINGKLVSLTAPIKVPLERNHQTVLYNKCLTCKTSEGINIDSNYEGNFNWIVP